MVFFAGIGTKAMGLTARGTDLVQQRLQFFHLAAADAGNVALSGKALGDFAPRGVACADHQHHFLLFCHARSLDQ
ncbi:hypothetical protein D3C80_1836790 [compost metagenome]